LTSADISSQSSLPIRSTMRRRSFAGSWILFCDLRKMIPSMPPCLPSVSSAESVSAHDGTTTKLAAQAVCNSAESSSTPAVLVWLVRKV